MLRLKNLKSTTLIRLMIMSIGMSLFGCNSSNQKPRRYVYTQRASDSMQIGSHTTRTSMTTGQHRRVEKSDGLGDALNDVGHFLADAITFTGDAAIVVVAVGARVIAEMFIDYQRWRLADAMFRNL